MELVGSYLRFAAAATLVCGGRGSATEPTVHMSPQGSSSSNLTSILNVPREVANRCSSFDLAQFTTARDCGSPLSLPCFDIGRCRGGSSIYVYDPEVTDSCSQPSIGSSWILLDTMDPASTCVPGVYDTCTVLLGSRED